jgi:hypothetical protein
MTKQESLRPYDVVVALGLADYPEASYEAIGAHLSMSSSTAHHSVARLQAAGLLRPGTRKVNRHSMLEFLEHGVRYAFPAHLDAETRGVPTAHSGPALSGEIVSGDVVVWPDINGSETGAALTPLHPRASDLPRTSPGVYELLTLVDAIRIGRIRERSKAIEKLRERLTAA